MRDRKAYFQYYETFEKIVQKFDTTEERDAVRTHIINYGLYGTEPEELNEKEKIVWDIVKDMIDDQVHRREVNRQNREKRRAEAENKAEEKPATEDEKEPKTEKKRFEKPTVDQVDAYCKERNNGLNAQQFVDYYEARGWKIGANSMKDWKAAVRTWEQRRTNEMPAYSNKANYMPSDRLTL